MSDYSSTGGHLSTISSQLVEIDFHGHQIQTFMANGEPHVAMRRIVENMDLNWATQRDKLVNDPKFSCTLIGTSGLDGKNYQMLSMPVRKLDGYLFSINTNRLKCPRKRDAVLRYQEKSSEALHSFWSTGVAVRDDMDGIVTDISPEVMKAFGGMVKGIVNKSLREQAEMVVGGIVREVLTEQVNQVVEAKLTHDPSVAAVKHIPALQVIVDKKVKPRVRGLAQKVSHCLTRFCEAKKVTILRDLGNRKLFPRETVNEWLAHGGWNEVKEWHDGRCGQPRFKLVKK